MLISTTSSVYRWDDEVNSPDLMLKDVATTAIAEGESTAVATTEEEIIDLETGKTIAKTESGSIECLMLSDGPDLSFLIGTEGPHIFEYSVSGLTRIESFANLEARSEWYTPWGGPASVRSFARTSDGMVYADIHVGSIARSEDGGIGWEMVTPDLHEDVHQVATCPADDDLVFANTANAVYTSGDRGRTWNHRSAGLPERYGRAIAVHPEDPECLLATVSRGPGDDSDGTLRRSTDGGRSWTHVTNGFPNSAEGNIDTFQIAFDQVGRAWAAVDTNLYLCEDGGANWTVAWMAPEPIAHIACGRR